MVIRLMALLESLAMELQTVRSTSKLIMGLAAQPPVHTSVRLACHDAECQDNRQTVARGVHQLQW